MGKHLLKNVPVVISISGMWLLIPEIKIPTEAWISLSSGLITNQAENVDVKTWAPALAFMSTECSDRL